MSAKPTDSELADELRVAADNPEALAALFAKVARPADDPPEHRGWVRRATESLRKGGHPRRAVNVVVAALTDLRRAFTVEDSDDDGGWHRQEAKRWQLWAHLWTVRRALAAVDDDSRERVSDSILALADPQLEGWFSPEDLEPSTKLAATDVTEKPDFARALQARLDAQVRLLGDETAAMERAGQLNHASESLNVGDPAIAAQLGLLALALDEAQISAENIAASPERDLVSGELLRPVQALLTAAVERGPPAVRDQIWRVALGHSTALLGRLQLLIGPDPATATEQVAMLRERRGNCSRDRERLDIDVQLIHEFGAHLEADEYLALCAAHGWTKAGMKRLLQAERADEAMALARKVEAARIEEEQSFDELPELAAQLLEFHQVQNATELLEPHKTRDATHGELYARCLLLQDSPEATAAHVAWFKQRPTVTTYSAVAGALPDGSFPAARTEMLAHLETRALMTTALDIAVLEGDLTAIDVIVLELEPGDLEHARLRTAHLMPKLSEKARRRLAPPTPETAAPKPDSKEAPTRVSHTKFGTGTVLAVEGTGEQTKYTIAFEDDDTRVLLARFVRPVE